VAKTIVDMIIIYCGVLLREFYGVNNTVKSC